MPNAVRTPLVRPYLKWAGGKRQILPEIRARLPEDLDRRIYYEPFVGAGAVLFALQPRQAVVCDCNEQLMLTYRAVRDDVEGLIALLEGHRARHERDYFYTVRAADRMPDFAAWSPTRKAARLIYLNKTCFNGLYRVNAKGWFNVPPGRYQYPVICEPEVLRAVSRYLNGSEITLLDGDFSGAVIDAGRDSFVYFDPPYHSAGRTGFTGYHAGGFDEDAQKRLHLVFEMLSTRGAKCMLSNAATAFILDLYHDYHIAQIPARRAINSRPAGRGAVSEVLITNY